MHGAGVTPVVATSTSTTSTPTTSRPTTGDAERQDSRSRGQVAPLMPIQDQIDLTTFGLLVAQHYAAFRQRYIIGWAADDESEAIKTARVDDADGRSTRTPTTSSSASSPQTDLNGYIKCREASLRHAASLSQTPAHELIGELVNLSAEALAAAEAGKDRKVDERQTTLGELHEQTFGLIGQLAGIEVPDDAQVVWRDTTARSFAATVDGLGKLAQMLGIPPEELWERVPGVTRRTSNGGRPPPLPATRSRTSRSY